MAKYIRITTNNRYVCDSSHASRPQTMAEQRKADVNRDARIAEYRERFSKNQNIYTGEPLSVEELEGVSDKTFDDLIRELELEL